jgi:hypothetical protein
MSQWFPGHWKATQRQKGQIQAFSGAPKTSDARIHSYLGAHVVGYPRSLALLRLTQCTPPHGMPAGYFLWLCLPHPRRVLHAQEWRWYNPHPVLTATTYHSTPTTVPFTGYEVHPAHRHAKRPYSLRPASEPSGHTGKIGFQGFFWPSAW